MDKTDMYAEAWRDLNKELGQVIKQRDQLAEALRDMLDQFDADECVDFTNDADYMAVKKARSALRQLEES